MRSRSESMKWRSKTTPMGRCSSPASRLAAVHWSCSGEDAEEGIPDSALGLAYHNDAGHFLEILIGQLPHALLLDIEAVVAEEEEPRVSPGGHSVSSGA